MYQALFYVIEIIGEQDRQAYPVSVYLICVYPPHSEIIQCDTSQGVSYDLQLAPTEFSSVHSCLNGWRLAL